MVIHQGLLPHSPAPDQRLPELHGMRSDRGPNQGPQHRAHRGQGKPSRQRRPGLPRMQGVGIMSACGPGAQRSEHRMPKPQIGEKQATRVGCGFGSRASKRGQGSYTALTDKPTSYLQRMYVTHPQGSVTGLGCSSDTRDESPTDQGSMPLFLPTRPRVRAGQRGWQGQGERSGATSASRGQDSSRQAHGRDGDQAGIDPGVVGPARPAEVVTPSRIFLHRSAGQSTYPALGLPVMGDSIERLRNGRGKRDA